MGVPVSKFKVNSHNLTLLVEREHSDFVFKDQSDDLFNVRLVKTTSSLNTSLHNLTETPQAGNSTMSSETNCDHGSERGRNGGYNQLKFIDDNEISEDSYSKEDVETDNDSGNASISSDNSHREDSGNESKEDDDDVDIQTLIPKVTRLRKRWSTLNFNTALSTRQLSASNVFKRYSTQSVLSQFEHCNVRKLVSKLNSGDLVEIRCLCNCLRGNQLRASINRRQRFRRTLQRQSFHQLPAQVVCSVPSKRHSSLQRLSSVFGRSCISGSMNDLDSIQSEFRSKIQQPSAPFVNNEQCIEQLHYVYVEKVDKRNCDTQLENIWCFHVKPYYRMCLLEDDKNLGVLKYETLDSIVGQFLTDIEERHWSCGRGFRRPKLSVHYQIRNQEKLSESILKQTLNAKPNSMRMKEVLMEAKDSHVRYHKTLCNSEHYVTLWKYGIGWSTWANCRADILRTLQHFVQSFSQLCPVSKIQLQGGECLQEQTNLVVHCFGLHGTKLEETIRQWMRTQVVIAKSMPDTIVQPASDHEDNESGEDENRKSCLSSTNTDEPPELTSTPNQIDAAQKFKEDIIEDAEEDSIGLETDCQSHTNQSNVTTH